MLPVTAACVTCGLDGWGQQPVIPIQKLNRDIPSSLMECSVCYEIIHSDCVAKQCPELEGVVNEDLPNSWECPKCCKEGKNVEYRPRHFRARQKSSDIRRMSISSDNNSMLDCKDGIKTESIEADSDTTLDEFGHSIASFEDGPVKRQKIEPQELSPAEPSNSDETTSLPPSVSNGSEDMGSPLTNNNLVAVAEPRKLALRTQLAHQLAGNSTKILKRASFIVRPSSGGNKGCSNLGIVTNSVKDVRLPGSLILEQEIVLLVFKHLSPADVGRCAQVCRTWARCSVEPSLWRKMDLSHKHPTASHLAGIARRQPEVLILDWSGIAKRQLAWLAGRLPQLRELSLQGCTWAGVSALRTCTCPPLALLDLSFVSGLNDASLRDILSPPPDSRPGLVDTKSRLRSLRALKLAGCDISDVSLRYVTQHLPRLTFLDISSCTRITDAGVAQLATPPASTIITLQKLDLSSCRLLTDSSLEHLARCDALTRLDLRHTPNVTAAAIAKFAVRNTSEDAKQDCWKQFYNFRIKNGVPVATELETFETICKKLDDAGEKPPDSAVMSKLLSSLPSRFLAFTMAWDCTAKMSEKRRI
uniref:F-box domain-containing protein n=1 Tax=Timema douglasi TaxID=61478 RepID=A0A7R8VSI4_TIMDO|nr:unnamed protein product [Timema douglasi]